MAPNITRTRSISKGIDEDGLTEDTEVVVVVVVPPVGVGPGVGPGVVEGHD